MKQIVPGLYYFTGLFIGRVYLIEDADGLTLIDASITQVGPKILKQLETIGRRPTHVKRILITHAHPDHVGALPLLKQETGAEVITSAIEQPVVEGKAPVTVPPADQVTGLAGLMRPKEGPTFPPVPVSRALNDGDTLPEVMGGLTAIATPGHTPGHTAYWQPSQRIIFCGDVIMRLPGLRLPFAAFTADMAEDKRSIRRVIDLNPAMICFGHGDPLRQDDMPRLRAFAQKVGAI